MVVWQIRSGGLNINRTVILRWLARSFLIFWQSLRVGLVILVLVVLYYLVPLLVKSFSVEEKSRGPVPTTVCGRLSGITFEVPRDYVFFWAEYEGASSWEPDFISNKKGCDANFVTLPLTMSWPEMKPRSTADIFRVENGSKGISVSISPEQRLDADMRPFLKWLLSDTPAQRLESEVFVESLKLHFVEGVERGSSDSLSAYYWEEQAGLVSKVFECRWSPVRNEYYLCEVYFPLPGVNALVDIRFPPENMKDWSLMTEAVQGFILSNIKR